MSTNIFSSNEKLKLDKFPLNYSNSNINIKNSIIKNNNTMKTIKNSENLYPNLTITLQKDSNISKKIVKKKTSPLNKQYFAKSPQIKRSKNLKLPLNLKLEEKLFSSLIIDNEYTPLTKEEKIEKFESIKVQSDRRIKLYGQYFKQIGNEINEINTSLNNFVYTSQKSQKKVKNINSHFLKGSLISNSNSKSNFNMSFKSSSDEEFSNIKIVDDLNIKKNSKKNKNSFSKSFEHGDSTIDSKLIDEKINLNNKPINIRSFQNYNISNYNKYYNYNKKKYRVIILRDKQKFSGQNTKTPSIIYNTSKSNADISNNISNCNIKCCKKDKDGKNDKCSIM
jgi:hypothetical protein